MSLLTYLAVPYRHMNQEVVEARVRAADTAMARLIREGYLVYSPVSMFHRAAIDNHLPIEAEYWRRQNYEILSTVDVVHVLRLDGWLDSEGVAE
ncbi:MAG TPA: DUF1937 family protein, partial [Candidatus Hydrogenedentes bacterium]|nr:DUF1937 family protein [Candidatus Hydrogenedentota bacterium]